MYILSRSQQSSHTLAAHETAAPPADQAPWATVRCVTTLRSSTFSWRRRRPPPPPPPAFLPWRDAPAAPSLPGPCGDASTQVWNAAYLSVRKIRGRTGRRCLNALALLRDWWGGVCRVRYWCVTVSLSVRYEAPTGLARADVSTPVALGNAQGNGT
jgi:hypothetical protein